jgi:hypothetical protein
MCNLYIENLKRGVKMKSFKLLIIVLSFLFLNLNVFADEDASNQDKTEINQAITNYVKGVDTRNSSELSKILIPDCSIIILNKITNSINSYTASQLIDMVKNGQKGGWTRDVTVNNVNLESNTAVAEVDIKDARLRESGFISLVKESGTWKVASEVATLQLNK